MIKDTRFKPPDTPHPFHIDLHVHTRRYSACAESLAPEMLKERMAQIGLHGLVITEHDALWSLEEIKALNEMLNPRKAFRGIEVSSSNGHFVVIGLDHLDGIRPGIAARELLPRVDGQGAVMILAHHHLRYSQTRHPLDISMMPDEIHAIEVASTATCGRHQDEAVQIALDKGWYPVAGSDAHAIESVGATFTAFGRMPKDEKELAGAIRNGMGIPMRLADNKGV